VDLTTRPGFGEFSWDSFVEVMHDYPDLAGFWIDNDNEYWEQNGLYELIRRQRPDMLLSNNNEDTPIMDTVSNEQKTGMTPPYDYPAATWTPMPRLTEADFKLPTKGGWWYDGSDSPVDYPLTVGRYITNAGASIKNLIAETAMVNGRFPSNQVAFNDFMAGYLPKIWESIHETEGGGYLYGGLQPGAWNDGAYDTVFRVEPAGREGIYRHVTASATASADGHPEANLTDGSYLNWWDSNATVPVPITLDLNPTRARYVKLEIDNTWAAPTVPNFYKKLAIDEIHVGWSSPTGHGNAR
jgi:hypothetical protein